jgi:hypothetical protein
MGVDDDEGVCVVRKVLQLDGCHVLCDLNSNLRTLYRVRCEYYDRQKDANGKG